MSRNENLARYVIDVRKRKGLTQEEVSKRGGPSTGWLGSLESGSRTDTPKASTLKKLAKGLGVSVAEVTTVANLDREDIVDIAETDEFKSVVEMRARLALVAEGLRETIKAIMSTVQGEQLTEEQLQLIKDTSAEYEALDKFMLEQGLPLKKLDATNQPKFASSAEILEFLGKAIDPDHGRSFSSYNEIIEFVEELNVEFPLTQEEKDILYRAAVQGMQFAPIMKPEFWAEPPEDRRSIFRHIEGLIDEFRKKNRNVISHRQASQE